MFNFRTSYNIFTGPAALG